MGGPMYVMGKKVVAKRPEDSAIVGNQINLSGIYARGIPCEVTARRIYRLSSMFRYTWVVQVWDAIACNKSCSQALRP